MPTFIGRGGQVLQSKSWTATIRDFFVELFTAILFFFETLFSPNTSGRSPVERGSGGSGRGGGGGDGGSGGGRGRPGGEMYDARGRRIGRIDTSASCSVSSASGS